MACHSLRPIPSCISYPLLIKHFWTSKRIKKYMLRLSISFLIVTSIIQHFWTSVNTFFKKSLKIFFGGIQHSFFFIIFFFLLFFYRSVIQYVLNFTPYLSIMLCSSILLLYVIVVQSVITLCNYITLKCVIYLYYIKTEVFLRSIRRKLTFLYCMGGKQF